MIIAILGLMIAAGVLAYLANTAGSCKRHSCVQADQLWETPLWYSVELAAAAEFDADQQMGSVSGGWASLADITADTGAEVSRSSLTVTSAEWESRKRSPAFAMLIMMALAGGGLPAQAAAADHLSTVQLAQQELPAVVSISSLRISRPASGASVTAGSGASEAAPSQLHRTHMLGSGFVIDSTGIIVTNRHVIEGATDILVTLQDNTLLRATVLAKADDMDIALLKVTPNSPLPTVTFGDSDAVRVGDQVVAIGNPLGLGGTVTRGIVSALNRDISDSPYDDFIQTDAAINHGNSGGPLFNERGEVIGMNTAIFSPNATSGSIGLGFAMPSNDVRYAAKALRRPGGMREGMVDFRVQPVTPEIADALDLPKAEGVIVAGAAGGESVSKSGVLPGDIILSCDNRPVKDARDFNRTIARMEPGTPAHLQVLRDEQAIAITATVREQPISALSTTPSAMMVADAEPGWNLARVDPTGSYASASYVPNTERPIAGVVVTQIVPDSAAADAGLSAGDVIVQVQEEKVSSPADVARQMDLARQRQHRYAVLLVQTHQGPHLVPVSLF
jgi:serine protease Do